MSEDVNRKECEGAAVCHPAARAAGAVEMVDGSVTHRLRRELPTACDYIFLHMLLCLLQIIRISSPARHMKRNHGRCSETPWKLIDD